MPLTLLEPERPPASPAYAIGWEGGAAAMRDQVLQRCDEALTTLRLNGPVNVAYLVRELRRQFASFELPPVPHV